MTPSITCPKCGALSFHPEDIKNRYCGRCNAFQAERTKPSDWAAEYVGALKFKLCGGCEAQCDEQILLAVRETLAKAVEVIEGHYNIDPKDSKDDAYDAAVGDMAAVVRALGATK